MVSGDPPPNMVVGETHVCQLSRLVGVGGTPIELRLLSDVESCTISINWRIIASKSGLATGKNWKEM